MGWTVLLYGLAESRRDADPMEHIAFIKQHRSDQRRLQEAKGKCRLLDIAIKYAAILNTDTVTQLRASRRAGIDVMHVY